jgi:molybdate transport system substrate-binding protein
MKKYALMTNTVRNVLLVLAVIMLCTLPAYAGEINLSAAASLRDVLNELTDTFAKKTPGVSFQKNYGASGAVAKQIENGAPADVYVSANVKCIDYLKEKKLVDSASVSILAYNEIVFVGKPNLKATTLKDVVNFDKISIGSPKSVPAGQYAEEALKKAGIYDQLERNGYGKGCQGMPAVRREG